jgi:hypothetical protein
MDTDAMSWRHSSLDSCCCPGPSEYIAPRMPGADQLEQGTRSLLAGPYVPLGVLIVASGVLIVEDADRVGRRALEPRTKSTCVFTNRDLTSGT